MKEVEKFLKVRGVERIAIGGVERIAREKEKRVCEVEKTVREERK